MGSDIIFILANIRINEYMSTTPLSYAPRAGAFDKFGISEIWEATGASR
jgi:hypothetical protein